MRTRKVLGQDSWQLRTAEVDLNITRAGGQIAPVYFRFGKRHIEPLHIAPWATENLDPRHNPPIIRALRGDFFCMPFGGNATKYRGEKHPVHGETANANWTLESLDQSAPRTTLRLSLNTRVRRGHVEKRISLVNGHHAIYSRHVISKMSGPMSFGHHAMLRFPESQGSGIVSTSAFTYGQVFPKPIERPENRGYSMLRPGAEFSSLESVAAINGEPTDLSRYPARRGFEDLVMMVSDARLPFSWTAATFPRERYVWFALKDPRVLRSTILWFSNGGRHYPPWNGRHVNVMGLEEVTSYFHVGLAESARPNPLAKRGITTSIALSPRKPLVVNYIMAVAQMPRGFDAVKSIEPARDSVRIVARSGKSVSAPLNFNFLAGGDGGDS